MAKFSIKNLPLNKRSKVILLGGVAGLVLIGGVAAAVTGPSLSVVPAPVPAPPKKAIVVTGKKQVPPPVPYTGPARLANLDQLHAEIQEATLRRDLAKLKAETRDAENGLSGAGMAGAPVSGGSALPPLPSFPVGGVSSMMPPTSLDMPPVPPSRQGGGRSTARGSSMGSAGGVEFLEAWGSGGDIQARVNTGSGERIVRVGDALPGGGRVARITGDAMTITDSRGKSRTVN